MVHRVPGFGVPSRACNSGNSNAAADESASSGCFFFFPLEGVASPQTAALTGTASTGSAWPTSEAAALLKTARGGRGATSPARQHGGACSPARVAWCAKLFRRLRLSSPQPCAESAAYSTFRAMDRRHHSPANAPSFGNFGAHRCGLVCAQLRGPKGVWERPRGWAAGADAIDANLAGASQAGGQPWTAFTTRQPRRRARGVLLSRYSPPAFFIWISFSEFKAVDVRNPRVAGGGVWVPGLAGAVSGSQLISNCKGLWSLELLTHNGTEAKLAAYCA